MVQGSLETHLDEWIWLHHTITDMKTILNSPALALKVSGFSHQLSITVLAEHRCAGQALAEHHCAGRASAEDHCVRVTTLLLVGLVRSHSGMASD